MTRQRSAPAGASAVAARSAGRARLPLLIVPSLLLTAGACCSAWLALGGLPPWLAPLMSLLLLVGYGRMALSAASALLGLWPRPAVQAAPASPYPAGDCTAILLLLCNEPPEPVAAALRVMAESLHAADNVAFFVLSDTQDPGRAQHEATVFPASTIAASGIRITYRRRTPNTGRKAGNIAEFCASHGRDYDFAIVLDADSLMTASAIRTLIDALRHDPDAGLIQSVSYPIGGATLFGRLQQFGSRLATPLSVAGQDLWQHRRGSYWGHNAILRLRPFTEHAVLPVLPGQPPLGGEILCHDTIEAALLLRAGWDVRLAPAITGSYETTPGNLLDYLARERRWCQGNLQHMRLLFEPGFPLASRLHIGMGILYYLASPAGLAASGLLLLGGVLARGHAILQPTPLAADLCLWLTLFLLFAPRLASLARALLLPGLARGFGGRLALLAGVLLDQLVGILIAPVIAVSVSGFVIATFRGQVVRWASAPRGNRPVGWAEATRVFAAHTAIGLAVTILLLLIRPALLPWSMPVLSGLLLAVPLARLSGSTGLGALTRRLGLFVTIDEIAPVAEQIALAGGRPAIGASPRRRRRTMPDGATIASGD